MSLRGGSQHVQDSEKRCPSIEEILQHHKTFIKRQQQKLSSNYQVLKNTTRNADEENWLHSTPNGDAQNKNNIDLPEDPNWNIQRFMRHIENSSNENLRFHHEYQYNQINQGIEKNKPSYHRYQENAFYKSSFRHHKDGSDYEEGYKKWDTNCDNCRYSYRTFEDNFNRDGQVPVQFPETKPFKCDKRQSSKFKESENNNIIRDEIRRRLRQEELTTAQHVETIHANIFENKNTSRLKTNNNGDLTDRLRKLYEKETPQEVSIGNKEFQKALVSRERIRNKEVERAAIKIESNSHSKGNENELVQNNDINDPRVLEIAKLIVNFFKKDTESSDKNRTDHNERVDKNNVVPSAIRTPTVEGTVNFQDKISTINNEIAKPSQTPVQEQDMNERRVNVQDKISGTSASKEFNIHNSRNYLNSFQQTQSQMTPRKFTTKHEMNERTMPISSSPKIYTHNVTIKGRKSNTCNANFKINPETRKRSRLREMTVRLENQLPLYDENSHLLGYLKKGTEIIGPSCPQSFDEPLIPKTSTEFYDCHYSICKRAMNLRRPSTFKGPTKLGTSDLKGPLNQSGVSRSSKPSGRWTYGGDFRTSVQREIIRSKYDRCPSCPNCS